MSQASTIIMPDHIEDLHEAGYLAANKDVQNSVDEGTMSCDFEHFIKESRIVVQAHRAPRRSVQ